MMFVIRDLKSFLLYDRISQPLAGGTAIFRLLPFSFPELRMSDQLLPSYGKNIFQGLSPLPEYNSINPFCFIRGSSGSC